MSTAIVQSSSEEVTAGQRSCRPALKGFEMPDDTLTGIKACVFDAYGTLFDFAAAAKGCRDILGNDVDRLTAVWRDKQLQNTCLRALQPRHLTFCQCTGHSLHSALQP